MEGGGLCGGDKSPHSDSFTAPKEPFDKRLGCKPNILMLHVIVMAYVCMSEYLGDVKHCLSLAIIRALQHQKQILQQTHINTLTGWFIY